MNKKERNVQFNNLLILICITLLIGIVSFALYIKNNKQMIITYNEKSDVDYKVMLKENDFYEKNVIEKDKGYIAKLIDTISADFKYNLDFSKKTNYSYSYKIDLELDVEDDKNNSNIYHYNENLVTKELTKDKNKLQIDESVKIKYDHYNTLISNFKESYDLRNTISKLNLVLYVSIKDINGSGLNVYNDKRVASLSIPLTENTVSVDVSDDSVNNTNKTINISKPNNNYELLIIGFACIFLSIFYGLCVLYYKRKTRTAQMIYEKEIKSIMNNYDSYIQKITGTYDIGTSQVLKVESFNDMLEIRDTLKQPILMLENESKNGTFFIIPATNSIIYTYALRVVDIKAKMEGKEIPTYDITEIPHADFKKNKKYTSEYIEEQLTMTSAMPIMDEKNVIEGNKSKEDLYDQLEKTTSFDIKEIRKAAKKSQKKTTKTSTTKKATKKD